MVSLLSQCSKAAFLISFIYQSQHWQCLYNVPHQAALPNPKALIRPPQNKSNSLPHSVVNGKSGSGVHRSWRVHYLAGFSADRSRHWRCTCRPHGDGLVPARLTEPVLYCSCRSLQTGLSPEEAAELGRPTLCNQWFSEVKMKWLIKVLWIISVSYFQIQNTFIQLI